MNSSTQSLPSLSPSSTPVVSDGNGENVLSLRPQRPSKNRPQPLTVMRHYIHPRLRIAGGYNSDEELDRLDRQRSEEIMDAACEAWWKARMEGDEYTPPWIRLPEQLE